MKNLLVPLFVVMFVSASGQKIFQEKIGVGYSTYTNGSGNNQASYSSRADITFGFSLMDMDKKFLLRNELEFELFLMKGSEDYGGMGGHTYYENLKGYSFIVAVKMQPAFRLKSGGYWFAGPVAGSNLKTNWEYNYRWYMMNSGAGSGHKSQSANEYFSRLFFGLSAGFINQFDLKNGNRGGVEFSCFYYFNFAEGFGSNNQFNRYGFRVSLVNPTGLIFGKKGPAGKIKSDVTN